MSEFTQTLWLIIWLEMETTCFLCIALDRLIGEIKIQVEVVLSGRKDMHSKIGNSPDLDQECRCPLFPTDRTTSIAQDH